MKLAPTTPLRHEPRSHKRYRKCTRLGKRERVSYIAGLKAHGVPSGLVVSADSQETLTSGDVVYVEKLATSKRAVVAGAGRGELVDGFCQHILEAFDSNLDSLRNEAAALALIRSALKEFHTVDVKLLSGRYKDVKFIIAVSLADGTCGMWHTKGMRAFPVKDYAPIGSESSFVYHLARSLYDPDLNLGQAVLLSVLLVVAAKNTIDAAGGNTALAIVTRHGVELKELSYIQELESRLERLEETVSGIRLACCDLSLSEQEFRQLIDDFQSRAEDLRTHYSERVVSGLLSRGIEHIRTSPYAELPTGRLRQARGKVFKYKEVDTDKWGVSVSSSLSPSASPSASPSPSFEEVENESE